MTDVIRRVRRVRTATVDVPSERSTPRPTATAKPLQHRGVKIDAKGQGVYRLEVEVVLENGTLPPAIIAAAIGEGIRYYNCAMFGKIMGVYIKKHTVDVSEK